MFKVNGIQDFLFRAAAIITAMVFHEFAHAFVSHKLGDPTPRAEGRLSINPFVHMDLFGALSLLLIGFGWARPVHVNPAHYKNPKQGMAMVSIAGPLMNFFICFICFLAAALSTRFAMHINPNFVSFINEFLITCGLINISLCVFNLIPLPPLDGFKFFSAFLPQELYFKILQYESYGMAILMVCMVMGWTDYFVVFASGIAQFLWKICIFIVGI